MNPAPRPVTVYLGAPEMIRLVQLKGLPEPTTAYRVSWSDAT